MGKICRGGNLVPEGKETWPVSGPGAERSCLESGGSLEDDGGGVCGSTKTAAMHVRGSSEPADALREAVLTPLRLLRDTRPESLVVSELRDLNRALSPHIRRLDDEAPDIGDRLGTALGLSSRFAAEVIAPSVDGPNAELEYSEELHRWFRRLAEDVMARIDDDEAREAIQKVLTRAEAFKGKRISDLRRGLEEAAPSG